MEASILAIISYIIRGIQTLAGGYAALKLGLYGVAYMRKNMQKVEEAKEGMTNVIIGLVIVIGCEAIVTFLKSGIKF